MKINFTRKFVPAAQTLQILRKAWLIKMRILSEALGYVMYFCYYLVHNYGLAIILFTLISKIVLLPVSVWVQKNSIKMVKMQPEINRIKAKHFGDADRTVQDIQEREVQSAGIPDPAGSSDYSADGTGRGYLSPAGLSASSATGCDHGIQWPGCQPGRSKSGELLYSAGSSGDDQEW